MFYVIAYLYHEETALEIETINFTTESLVFHNRHLNGIHSISDIRSFGSSVSVKYLTANL